MKTVSILIVLFLSTAVVSYVNAKSRPLQRNDLVDDGLYTNRFRTNDNGKREQRLAKARTPLNADTHSVKFRKQRREPKFTSTTSGKQKLYMSTPSSITPPPLSTTSSSQPITEIGTTFFSELVTFNDIFVDKSLFIREFLNTPNKVLLITRPKRWGKTINTDMLKTFLQLEIDKKGHPLPRDLRLNHKFFTGGRIDWEPNKSKILRSLKISKHPDCMKYQGMYPVIFVSFAGFVGTSFQEIEDEMKLEIRELFQEHSYLESKLLGDERDRFVSYTRGNIKKMKPDGCLLLLSKLLNQHFKKRVYVLIDEFDTTISSLAEDERPAVEEVQRMAEFFRDLFGSCLRDNRHLEKVLVSGVLRRPGVDLFKDLDDVLECDLLSENFEQFYGFTEAEINDMANKVSFKVDIEGIKRWYGGYKFGKEIVYNPWSIMWYLARNKFNRYWLENCRLPSWIEKSMRSDEFQSSFTQKLISCECVVVSNITANITFDSLRMHEIENLISLLLFTGYLASDQYSTTRGYQLLHAPNEEFKVLYESSLESWLDGKNIVTYNGWIINDFNKIADMLLTCRFEEFENKLKEIILDRLDCRQIGGTRPERVYYIVVKFLLQSYHCEIKKDNENDSMIILEPINRYTNAAIVKIKVARNNKNELRAEVNKGLEEIDENILKINPAIKSIVKICIGFNGVDLDTAHRVIEIVR